RDTAEAAAGVGGAAGVPGFDATDPVHVAEFACYLASPAAGWVSGQTFQVSGPRVQHVASWSVRDALVREGAGFTAADLALEVPRLFGAAPRPAERPPAAWSDRYHARQSPPP